MSKLEKDDTNIKVVVDIGKYDKIVSVMSCDSLKNIDLVEGSVVQMEIKSNDIMLGK